jgi:hypothetical protein
VGGRGKWGVGGEMAQTMYAHMNKQIKKKKKRVPLIFLIVHISWWLIL